MRVWRKLAADTDLFEFLKSLKTGAERRAAIELLGPEDRDSIDRAWEAWAHDGQREPAATATGGEWSTWVIKAGRGFGKTLAGAQWITGLVAANEDTPLSIALVGATVDDARRVMVEGRSGLIEVAGQWLDEWIPSLRRLRFRTGAEATLFSGQSPDMLRGPEHHFAWCDELAKWDKPQESWDMLQLGLRLGLPGGAAPRALITTTPRPGPVLKTIMEEPDTAVTGGPTQANPHLPGAWKRRVERLYAGTRLGRQELDGELLPDAAGALWTVELLERCRTGPLHHSLRSWSPSPVDGGGFEEARPPSLAKSSPIYGGGGRAADGGGPFTRTLIAVDPPSGDGTCGIIACARAGSGDAAIAHVLADHSVTGRSPEGWAGAVAAASLAHGTAEVVAEANQGGKMVRAVLHTAGPGLRVKMVNARLGKAERAEPVSHLFEAGRAFLHGDMPELEAQLLGLIAGGGYEGPGVSPDRADAMVWGLTALMLGTQREPRIRMM